MIHVLIFVSFFLLSGCSLKLVTNPPLKPFFTGYTADSYKRIKDFCFEEYNATFYSRIPLEQRTRLEDECWFNIHSWEGKQIHYEEKKKHRWDRD